MRANYKKRATRRLQIIKGQIRGLAKMVAQDKYCPDIIRQSWAIKAALASFEDLILENHLKTHLVKQIRTGERVRAAREMLAIYKLAKR